MTLRHERALAWRLSLGIARAVLAERIGYPASTIQEFEEGKRRGKTGPLAQISDAHWLRYGMACAAYSNNLKPPF